MMTEIPTDLMAQRVAELKALYKNINEEGVKDQLIEQITMAYETLLDEFALPLAQSHKDFLLFLTSLTASGMEQWRGMGKGARDILRAIGALRPSGSPPVTLQNVSASVLPPVTTSQLAPESVETPILPIEQVETSTVPFIPTND